MLFLKHDSNISEVQCIWLVFGGCLYGGEFFLYPLGHFFGTPFLIHFINLSKHFRSPGICGALHIVTCKGSDISSIT